MTNAKTKGRPGMVVALLLACLLSSCGGGGGSDACERVSAGSSSIAVQNDLPSGLEASFPQFAFGADMASGECNIVGLEYSASTLAVQVRLQQCNNAADNTDCTGKLFGPVRLRTIQLDRGGSETLTVNAAIFQ